MILDGYWKIELLRNKLSLKIWYKLGNVFNKLAEHQINKAILYSAVIMRKMFEDEKGAENEIKKTSMSMPPFNILKYKVNVTVYPFSGDKDFIVERVIPENYDYKKAVTKEIGLNKLCNQIIHSYVWSVVHSQNKIYGVMFASDKYKTDGAYLLVIEDFIRAIEFFIEEGTI